MIDNDYLTDLSAMLNRATQDLVTYGPSCRDFDNGNRTFDILTTNLCVINRLLQYATNPPTFTYFLHSTEHVILFNGSDFATVYQMSIHT